MKRPALSFGLIAPLALIIAGLQVLGCESGANITCPKREHPGHLDEYGEPDPCCLGAIPCCSNPLWGRRIISTIGAEMDDPCCLAKPCPNWDVNKGSDAGTEDAGAGAEMPGMADGGTMSAANPDAGMAADSGP